MEYKKCPNCGLVVKQTEMFCNCGYEFNSDFQNKLCEKCNRIEGTPYSIYYGIQLNTTTHSTPTQTTLWTSYKCMGKKDVIVCNKCIHKNRLIDLFVTIGVILLGLTLLFRGVHFSQFDVSDHMSITQIIGFFIIGIGFIKLIITLVTSNKDIGEIIAVSLNKVSLKSKGFNTIWTPAQYERLSKLPTFLSR